MIVGIHPISGLPIIEEQRKPERWRVLPKHYGKRAKEMNADINTPWHPAYQDIGERGLVGVGCMKCRRPIQGWQPQLIPPEARKKNSASKPRVYRMPDGTLGIGIAMVPYNHFRVGWYLYFWGNEIVPSRFEFVHCADCIVKDEHAMELLACTLCGLDDMREWSTRFTKRKDPTDSEHATSMWRFSQPIDFIGIEGPSQTVSDMMIASAKELAERERKEKEALEHGG